jgi:hypothetical protein
MALSLNFTFCTTCDCKNITFTETTGTYDSSTNTGGWEAASSTNPGAYGVDATAATLEVTDPGGSTHTIDLFADHSYPKADNSSVELSMADLGGTQGDKPADGLYVIKYTVTTGAGDPAGASTYTKEIRELFYCNAQCCVHSMLADLQLECDTCDKDKKDDAIFAYTLLQDLKYSAACRIETNFDALIDNINRLCDAKNCRSCG